MTDESEKERPSGRRNFLYGNPVAALRREQLKYAYRNRRDTPAIRADRKLLEDYIATIQPEPVAEPSGDRLEVADRYRRGRPDKRGPDER